MKQKRNRSVAGVPVTKKSKEADGVRRSIPTPPTKERFQKDGLSVQPRLKSPTTLRKRATIENQALSIESRQAVKHVRRGNSKEEHFRTNQDGNPYRNRMDKQVTQAGRHLSIDDELKKSPSRGDVMNRGSAQESARRLCQHDHEAEEREYLASLQHKGEIDTSEMYPMQKLPLRKNKYSYVEARVKTQKNSRSLSKRDRKMKSPHHRFNLAQKIRIK